MQHTLEIKRNKTEHLYFIVESYNWVLLGVFVNPIVTVMDSRPHRGCYPGIFSGSSRWFQLKGMKKHKGKMKRRNNETVEWTEFSYIINMRK